MADNLGLQLRPFSCKHCPRRVFKYFDRYRIHQRRCHERHTGQHRQGYAGLSVSWRNCETFSQALKDGATHKLMYNDKGRGPHTEGKPYQCAYCDKRFCQSHNKTIHERIHTKEKPYQCAYCDKRFSQRSGKIRHERIHTKERPFQCSHTHCDMTFSFLCYKDRHERIHTNEKHFQCAYCDMRFSQRGNKTRHERIHTRNPTNVDIVKGLSFSLEVRPNMK